MWHLRRQCSISEKFAYIFFFFKFQRSILNGVANVGITYAGFANSIINNEFREDGLAALEKDLDDLEDMVTGLEAVATNYASTLSSACTFVSS